MIEKNYQMQRVWLVQNKKNCEDKNEVLYVTFVFDKIDLCPTYSPF